MVSENAELTKECIALKDKVLQAEFKIKTKDESLAEAKQESEKLRNRIDNLGEQKEAQQKEISAKEEEIKEITQQIDRLTKKEEMNGHLKDQYEEEVQKLRKENALQKEQYRQTFDQLTVKENELRESEEAIAELEEA